MLVLSLLKLIIFLFILKQAINKKITETYYQNIKR